MVATNDFTSPPAPNAGVLITPNRKVGAAGLEPATSCVQDREATITAHSGAPLRNRTPNPLLTKQPLYLIELVVHTCGIVSAACRQQFVLQRTIPSGAW